MSHVVKHINGYCTEKTTGFMVCYNYYNPMLPQCQNNLNRTNSVENVYFFDRFVRLCTVCLAYVLLCSGAIVQ